MKKFLKGKMKRYIGNGTEIKKFYRFLVANELVHSDYILAVVCNYGMVYGE
nr:MAG TPA: hypothetical protein [Caudoviricetes sp.]